MLFRSGFRKRLREFQLVLPAQGVFRHLGEVVHVLHDEQRRAPGRVRALGGIGVAYILEKQTRADIAALVDMPSSHDLG